MGRNSVTSTCRAESHQHGRTNNRIRETVVFSLSLNINTYYVKQIDARTHAHLASVWRVAASIAASCLLFIRMCWLPLWLSVCVRERVFFLLTAVAVAAASLSLSHSLPLFLAHIRMIHFVGSIE